MGKTIIVADDHPMVRAAIRHIISSVMPDSSVLEAVGFKSLDALVRQHPHSDLILLDLTMPGSLGFSSLLYLRAEFPAIPVIVVSSSEDIQTIYRAYRFGAAGFLPKSVSMEAFREAICAVLDGKEWFTKVPDAVSTNPDAIVAKRMASLTPQQIKVLMSIAQGKSNKTIADDLGIAENTLKVHISAIFKKLSVSSRTQAALLVKSLEAENSHSAGELLLEHQAHHQRS